MSGKFNNRILWLVFLLLVAVFVISRFTRVRHGKATLVTEVVSIDTSQVTSFTLYPQAEAGQSLNFEKSGDAWQVTRGTVTAPAAPRAVSNLLEEISALRAEQLVSRDPEKWPDYSVTDSLGSRIVIREGNREALDLVVGRFRVQPPQQNNRNMYGQNRVSGKTFIRLSGEDNVYSVDGFFALSVNRGFSQWRNNVLSRVNTARLTGLQFEYPADSGFVARKSDEHWQVAGLTADSASMAQYLNGLRNVTHSDFDDSVKPEGNPAYRLTMEGDNMSPVVIRAFTEGDSTFLVNSSLNPATWFRTGYDPLFHQLFPGASTLLPEGS